MKNIIRHASKEKSWKILKEYEEEYEEDIKKGYIRGFAWTREFMGNVISNGVRGNELRLRTTSLVGRTRQPSHEA
jgi:hypothetical protein